MEAFGFECMGYVLGEGCISVVRDGPFGEGGDRSRRACELMFRG